MIVGHKLAQYWQTRLLSVFYIGRVFSTNVRSLLLSNNESIFSKYWQYLINVASNQVMFGQYWPPIIERYWLNIGNAAKVQVKLAEYFLPILYISHLNQFVKFLLEVS